MKKIITYSLLDESGSSNKFYIDIAGFTDLSVLEANISLKQYVDSYYSFLEKNKLEILRSKNEYLLELMMIGIFWSNYIQKAENTSYLSRAILKNLYLLRKSNKALKPLADKLRGYLAFAMLNKGRKNKLEQNTLVSYTNLLNWLIATGEFNEEVIRLKPWAEFYKTKTDLEVNIILESAITASVKFTNNARSVLGKYTNHVHDFINNSLEQYKQREDYFFTSRHENEYFLNMFGAEIMNRQLRSEFEKTQKKAVLLPTCMRIPPKTGCKAISDGKELVCMQCNSDCNIGKIARIFNKEYITPYLIPHSSDFSKFLIKWKDNKDTGLIGVACVLNLLTGGYEMKRLHIASQCVFLDYCGCKNHWDSEGFFTNLNCNKLRQIIIGKIDLR